MSTYLTPLSESDRDVLETFIDQHSLAVVLDALADIAYAKADHVQTNWQDDVLESAWIAVGGKLSRTSAFLIDSFPEVVV